MIRRHPNGEKTLGRRFPPGDGSGADVDASRACQEDLSHSIEKNIYFIAKQ